MEIIPENRGHYLFIKVSGRLDTRGLEFGFPTLLKYLKEQRIEKLLLDCREVYGSYPIEERLFVNESLADVYLNYSKDNVQLKIAAVLDKSLFHPNRLGEKIAKNRGLVMINTESIEEAYAWLEVVPPAVLPQEA